MCYVSRRAPSDPQSLPPSCHPDAKEFRNELRNDVVEVLRSGMSASGMSASGQKRSKTASHDTGDCPPCRGAAGSAMGLLNVCLAFVTFCRDRRHAASGELSALSYLIDFAGTVEDACPYKRFFVQAYHKPFADSASAQHRGQPRCIMSYGHDTEDSPRVSRFAVLLRSVAISQIIAKCHSALQNFDSVRLLRNLSLAQDDTRGGGAPCSG